MDLGFFVIVFCSIAIAGQIPLISSTSGFSIFPRNCFAYEDKLSIYLLCPSAYRVSNANVDFPDPETPDITVILFLLIDNDKFLRLCCFAPIILIWFLNIFCGLIPPDSGEIFVDGRKVNYSNYEGIKDNISYISQTPFLADDTIVNNIILSF